MADKRTFDFPTLESPAKRHIHEQYERLKPKFVDGRLFGEPIDTNDIEAMVVAAYFMGSLENLRTNLHNIETLEKVMKADGG